MFWRKKKSFCKTCPARSTACLAGHCELRTCNLCAWCVDVGWLKNIISCEGRYQCSAPGIADEVKGGPGSSCSSARNYAHLCGKEGKKFLHKEQACPGGETADTQG